MTSFADPGGGPAPDIQTRSVRVDLDADVSGYSQALGQAQQQTAAMIGQLGLLNSSMSSLGKFAAHGIHLFDAANSAGFAIATADAAMLEHQLGTLRATSAVTGTSMDEMKAQMDKAFTSFPVARAQVVQLYETINSLGVTAPKAVGSMANTFLKLGGATGEDPTAVAAASLQVDRQMGNMDPESVARYANALLTVSKNQGVAVAGVNEFASAIAPMARAAGIGEAAVYGISAAFQRAGADGGRAATAFSSIIGDITQATATDSAEVAKYASFVGKTREQFMAMSGTQKFTEMFTAISKGGPEALSFMNSLGQGTQGMRAIQAVAQSGSLGQAIAESTGGSHDTTNLDKASETAYHGLTDSIIEVGNQLTKLGETLGGPLLWFSTKLADAFGTVLDLTNKFVSALGPVPGLLSDLAGVLAGPLGFALSHFSTIATLATARTLLGPNSMGRVAYRAGNEAGQRMAAEIPRLMATGMTREAATAQARENAFGMTRSGIRMLSGEANMRTAIPFNAGLSAGQRPGIFQRRYGTGPLGMAGQGLIAGRNVLVGGTTWLFDEHTRSLRDSQLVGDERSGQQPRVPGSTLREHIAGASFGDLRRAAATSTVETAAAAGSMGTSFVGGVARTVTRAQEAEAARNARLAINAAVAAARAGVDTEGMTRAQARAARAAAEATAAAGAVAPRPPPPPAPPREGFTTRAGSTYTLPSGVIVPGPTPIASQPHLPTVAGAVEGAGGAAARGGGALFRGAAAFGGALMSPLGMIAMMVGVPLISGVVSAIKEGNAQKADVSESLVGAARYDQALDRTSTNLARFGQSVDSAADKLSTFANTPVKDTLAVTGEDRAAVTTGGYKIGDTNPTTGVSNLQNIIQSAAESDPTGTKGAVRSAAVNWLSSQGLQAGDITGTTSTALKRDLMSALKTTGGGGDFSADVESYMRQWYNQPGGPTAAPNFATAGQLAGSATSFEGFKSAFGIGVQGLKGATYKAGDAGTQARALNLLSMGAAATANAGTGQNERIAALGDYMQQEFGVDPKQFRSAISQASNELGTGVNRNVPGTRAMTTDPYQNQDQANQVLALAFSKLPQGQTIMGLNGGMTQAQFLAGVQNPGALPPVTASNTAVALSQKGPLGTYAANQSPGFLEAADSSNAAKKFASVTDMVGEAARQAGGNMIDATGNLTQLSDAIQGASGALLKSAADWARYRQSLVTPTTSREAQLGSAAATAARDAAAANPALSPSDATVQQSQDSIKALDASKESYRQYMIGRIQTITQFNTQQQRAIESNRITTDRSNRDFEEQQRRSQDAYQLSVDRAHEDFTIQQARAEYSFGLQKLRAQEDYQTSSERSLKQYQLSVDRANEDHARDLQRQAAAAAQDIYDPYSRIQRKATTDAGTLIQNLQEQNADLARQVAQIAELKQKGLSQQAIDTLKLADAGNAQQVSALVQSLTQNPDMTAQINTLVAQRVTNTTTLTQSPENVVYRQAEEDFAKQMSRQATDFETVTAQGAEDFAKNSSRMSQDYDKQQQQAAEDNARSLARQELDYQTNTGYAVADHKKALSDMAIDFKRTQDQAAQDLLTSFTQYTGDFASVFEQLTSTSLANLGTYAPQAAAVINAELAKIKNQNPWAFGAGGTAPTIYSGYVGQYSTGATAGTGGSKTPTTYSGGYMGQYSTGHAYGGISLTQHTAMISEHGPEMILPLNSHGENFMAGLIARSLAQGVTAATSGGPDLTHSMSSDNSVSFAGADIKVVASDPTAMARALTAKAKLARLASPVRH